MRFCWLLLCWLAGAVHAATPWDDAKGVPREAIVEAIRAEQAKGYRLDAIANAVRLQTAVLLALADAARAADVQQRPLRIDHRDYRAAFMAVTGLAEDALPSFVRAAHAAAEDLLVDYRADEVYDAAASADRPRRALNVKTGWPEGPGAPDRYSYVDRSIDPAIETTRLQVCTWRVLDFGDTIVIDELQGVSGRATSGLLGAIFALIGHAQARQTRYAFAPDGTQISRTTAKKGLTLTQTVTISPEGKVLTGLPPERPDLAEIEQRLAGLPMRVAYRPIDRSPVPAPP